MFQWDVNLLLKKRDNQKYFMVLRTVFFLFLWKLLFKLSDVKKNASAMGSLSHSAISYDCIKLFIVYTKN